MAKNLHPTNSIMSMSRLGMVTKLSCCSRILLADSLCYHIQTEDVYKDMQEDQDLFDTSDYPQDHLLYSNTNKKGIGKFKDETVGETLREFIGLRAKMYSFMMDSGKEKKTA